MDYKYFLQAGICLICFLTSNGQNLSNDLCSRYCSFTTSQTKNIDSLIQAALAKPESTLEDTAIVQRAIEQILCIVKTNSKSFISKPYDDRNACAIECNNLKYILYNTSYLIEASQDNKFAFYGILAHEIGHHIRGDAWITNVKDVRTLHEAELAADEFAGKVLGMLNVPIDQTIKTLSLVDEEDTQDHPSRQRRQERMRKGWEEGGKNQIPDIKRMYELQCQTNIESGYKMVLDPNKVKTNFFSGKKRFGVYIESVNGNTLEDIERMEYYLHPTTFKNNIYRTKKYKNDFAVFLKVYGNFELRGTLFFKDGREYLLIQKLEVFEEDSTDGK